MFRKTFSIFLLVGLFVLLTTNSFAQLQFVPVVIGYGLNAAGRVVPIIRMVAVRAARNETQRRIEQARETQKRLDQAGFAQDIVNGIEEARNNPISTQFEERKAYDNAFQRYHMALRKEQQLNQEAMRINPNSFEADRIYRAAASASKEKAAVEIELQLRHERVVRTTVVRNDTNPSNSAGANKGDRFTPERRERDSRSERGDQGSGRGGTDSWVAPKSDKSTFNPTPEKNNKRDLVGPKVDKSFFDPKPSGGEPKGFTKEKRNTSEAFTKRN